MQVDIHKVVDVRKVIGEEEVKVGVGYKVTCTFANKDTYCFVDKCTDSQIPDELHKRLYSRVKDTVTVDQALYSGTSVDTIQSGGAGVSMILYALSLDLTIAQNQRVFIALCGLICSDLPLLTPSNLGTDESALPLRVGVLFSEYPDMYFVLESKGVIVVLRSDSYVRNLTLILSGKLKKGTPYKKMIEAMAYAYNRVPYYLEHKGTQTKKYEGDYSVTIKSKKYECDYSVTVTSEKRQ